MADIDIVCPHCEKKNFCKFYKEGSTCRCQYCTKSFQMLKCPHCQKCINF